MSFVLISMLLITATIIVCNPFLLENFNKFFNANAMGWEQCKHMLIADYIMCLPLSFIMGIFLYPAFIE